MAVDRVERDRGDATQSVEETWTARDCGQREQLRVPAGPSARGGVDISERVQE